MSAASPEQRLLHRLHCVLLIAEGRSCYEVARWFGSNPRTIERWVHAFDQRAIEGLREHRTGGRRARLSGEVVQRLALDLNQPPDVSGSSPRTWSGAKLTRFLAERYGIRLSTRQCQRVLSSFARAGSCRTVRRR
jgi:transposase